MSWDDHQLDSQEVERLLDLLPTGMRPNVEVVTAPERQTRIIKGRRLFPWRHRLRISIKPYEWKQFTPNQRASLFLHKVGYHSWAMTRQMDFYVAVAAFGGISLIVEGLQQDPIGIGVSGGLASLALWQWRQDQTNDRRLLAADAYAVDRLVLRGMNRWQAVEALGQALHVEAHLEGRSGNDLLDIVRYQNLKRLAQRPAEDIVLG
ncbi:MAG: DUF3318 domain-containing protein [Thermostichales cyanobacterium SZTDM-1c_bins_54]